MTSTSKVYKMLELRLLLNNLKVLSSRQTKNGVEMNIYLIYLILIQLCVLFNKLKGHFCKMTQFQTAYF